MKIRSAGSSVIANSEVHPGQQTAHTARKFALYTTRTTCHFFAATDSLVFKTGIKLGPSSKPQLFDRSQPPCPPDLQSSSVGRCAAASCKVTLWCTSQTARPPTPDISHPGRLKASAEAARPQAAAQPRFPIDRPATRPKARPAAAA